MNKSCCFQNTSSHRWWQLLNSSSPPLRFDIPILKTSQELWMLSSVTINCQVTMIDWIQVLNRQNCNRCLKCQVSQTVLQMVKICLNIIKMQKVLKVLKVIKSCLLITLIRCLSDHKFLELFFAWQKWKSVSELVSQSVSDKVTYWAVLDS